MTCEHNSQPAFNPNKTLQNAMIFHNIKPAELLVGVAKSNGLKIASSRRTCVMNNGSSSVIDMAIKGFTLEQIAAYFYNEHTPQWYGHHIRDAVQKVVVSFDLNQFGMC